MSSSISRSVHDRRKSLADLIEEANYTAFDYPATHLRPSEMQSPMSNFGSPASFMTASSSASFITARSIANSPAYHVPGIPSSAMRIETIREDEPPEHGMPKALKTLHNDYYATLHKQSIVQPFDKELNWSGKGQHVTFTPRDAVPLILLSHLGSSMTATVEKVICRRIALARKTMRCYRGLTVVEALREVYHLQNLRHFHIVQLVGSYLQGRCFSILMYPVADYHLATFFEDTSDMRDFGRDDTMPTMLKYSLRMTWLASTLSCLSSAVAFIHDRTTKHMDIKPQNILVRTLKEEDAWRIYLADFGLSRSFAAQDHSQTDGPTSRTPRYCAPEVYAHNQRGRSADIFSLGCVFLEILTVYADNDLQHFADVRRGDGDDESFHANLERVGTWIESMLQGKDERGVGRIRDPIELVKQMVQELPDRRPLASDLQLSFSQLSKEHPFASRNCCTQPPEPYTAYKPAVPYQTFHSK